METFGAVATVYGHWVKDMTDRSLVRLTLLYVHRDRTDYHGRGAQDVLLFCHTATAF